MLSERKKKILQAVINENIKNAEPVSSKELQEHYLSSVSSATIRNELMALEEMGYLTHPYTSSGRVPTTSGFKKYIDELMTEAKLTDDEIDILQDNFKEKINNIEDLAIKTAEAISKTSNYASIVKFGIQSESIIENIKIVKITDELALALIVTDVGVIKDITLNMPATVTEEDCISASKILTDTFSGLTIAEAGLVDVASLINDNIQEYKMFFELLIEAIKNHKTKEYVKVDGTSNLLNQPEYKSVEKAQKAITLFENKELLTPLVSSGNDLEISIKVGVDDEQDCSVVSAVYKINGKPIGTAGVVGPVRMDYAKAVSVLKQINSNIKDSINFSGKSTTNLNIARRSNGKRTKGRKQKSK